jgi:hypothetical protein
MGWATFWAIFSKTRPVALLATASAISWIIFRETDKDTKNKTKLDFLSARVSPFEANYTNGIGSKPGA